MDHSEISKLRHRVLVVDEDSHFSRRFTEFLAAREFSVRLVTSMADAVDAAKAWAPVVIFVGLEANKALALIKALKETQIAVNVILHEADLELISDYRRAGAAGYLVSPFALDEAAIAVEDAFLHTPPEVSLNSPAHDIGRLTNMLHESKVDASSQEKLFKLVRMINLQVKAMRSSLIECMDVEHGRVLASNDNENIAGFRLNLNEYPEVQEVMKTRRPLIIRNVRTSDVMAPVQDKIRHMSFETLVVFPVLRDEKFFGVLSLRMEQKSDHELPYIEELGRLCSQMISLSMIDPLS